MNKNHYFLGIGLIALVIAFIGVMSVTKADDTTVDFKEHRAETIEIFENDDYNAWAEMMNEKVSKMEQRLEEMKNNITEERFEQMKEMHGLMQAGDWEGVKALKEELGMKGLGMRGFKMNKRCPFMK